jgi:hypothetical protein
MKVVKNLFEAHLAQAFPKLTREMSIDPGWPAVHEELTAQTYDVLPVYFQQHMSPEDVSVVIMALASLDMARLDILLPKGFKS